MGQKAHPYGLRLGYIKPWKGKWFVRKGASDLLHEDLKLRKYLKAKLGFAGVSNIEIERFSGKVRVRIFTARPGIIIGRRGQEIEKVREDLSKLTKDELFLDIKEVKNPQTDAQLVAENITTQLEKRIAFRRAMKRAVQMAMMKGAGGIKVICKGRLGGAEIARQEKYHEGKVPLGTFRADVDYGFAEAHTTYGAIGCKVWIYKGDILVKKEEAAQKSERRRQMIEREKSSKAPEQADAAEKPAATEVVTPVETPAAQPEPAPQPETTPDGTLPETKPGENPQAQSGEGQGA